MTQRLPIILGLLMCVCTAGAAEAGYTWKNSPHPHTERTVPRSNGLATYFLDEHPFGKRFQVSHLAGASFVQIKHSEYRSRLQPLDVEADAQSFSTRLTLAQETPWGRWHFSNVYGPDERQRYAGVTVGATTLMLSNGHGHTYMATENAFGAMNPYLFHGGNLLPYTYSGLSINRTLSVRSQTTFAATRVSSPGVDDRMAVSGGIAIGGYAGSLIGVERGGEMVARGVDLTVGKRRFRGVARQLRHNNGASYRRLGVGWHAPGGVALGLHVEQSKNPLFRDAEDTKLLLTLGGRWGGAANRGFNAAESGTPDEAKQIPKGYLLGGGLAAIALIASSGSDSKDRAARYGVQHDAGFMALNSINPKSVRENREYGGWIYRNADGSYSHTRPVKGDATSVDIGPPSVAPVGTAATATYHTHAAFDARFDNENFSPTDTLSDRFFGVDGYLGTPAGFMKYHNVQTGKISTIRRIAN